MDRHAPLETEDPVATAFLALTSEAVVVTGEDHRILTINQRTEELFGHAFEEIAGEPFSTLLARGVPEAAAAENPEDYVARLASARGALLARRKSGEEFPIEAACAQTSRNAEFVIVLRDLSERQETADALDRAQRGLEQILQSAGEGIYGLDHEGRTTFVNRAAAEMLGWVPEEMLGELQHAVIHHTKPDGTEYTAESCPIYAAFTDGEVHRVDHEVFWRKDGTSFPVEYVSTPIRGASGELTGAVVTFRDITERNRARAVLERLQRTRELILQSAGEGIYGLDHQGLTTFVNPAAAEMLGWEADELLGKSQHAVSHHTKSDGTPFEAVTCPIYAAFSDGQVHRVSDEVFWRKDGTSFPVEYVSTPIHDAEEGLVGAVVTFRDITERKEAERALHTALSELQVLKDRLAAENAYLQEEIELEHGFEEIVGNCRPLKEALVKIRQVAPTTATVLIFGETGTGKELFARAIHRLSGREDRPLVKVNCAALPSGLVESELFGHERGAFTGAIAKRMGRFALAHKGTIFLDEIGDIPLDVQAKLLRVLQEGEFDPVGSTQTLKVDVRVIAATNRDLRAAVKAGDFRADLYYRISVFPIEAPPLRERREDIPALVALFADRYSTAFGRDVTEVSQRAMDTIQRYPWPGNIRELQNVIERAVIVSPDSTLRLDEVLDAVDPVRSESESEALEDVERQHILRVLEATGWQVAGSNGAAERLQINASTLRSRMSKLGLRRPAIGT